MSRTNSSRKRIYSVVHEHFVTDHLAFTTSLIRATSVKEAREKFNRLASKRREYPYCWSNASSISEAEIIE